MKKLRNSSKGITLVALVVTIIVLIILASVSISLVLGDHGLLKMARNARTETHKAQIIEKIQFAEIAATANANAKIDYDTLVAELTSEFGTKGTDWDISEKTENPWTVTVEDVEYEIKGSTNETLAPGLYYAGTDEMIMTWEELVDPNNSMLQYNSGTLSKSSFSLNNLKDKNGNTVGTNLVKLVVDESITSISGMGVITQLAEIILPSTITRIQAGGFYSCTDLKSVKMQSGDIESNTEIGVEAFKGCENLEKIKLPNNLTKLERSAFENCKSLKEIELPGLLDLYDINGAQFRGCTGLKKVVIQNGITNLPDQLFSGCTSLESVDIPNSVTTIEDFVFVGCTSIKNLNIPYSVTSIGTTCFGGWNDTQTINVPFKETEKPSNWSHTIQGCNARINYAQ